MNYPMTSHLENKKFMKHLLSIVLLITGLSLVAQIPQKPEPFQLVNDYAGFLTQQETSSLEQKLRLFEQETSNQIAIVVLKDLMGYDKAQLAFELAEQWGVGQKGKDNGILILVKPKYPNSKGEVFIATGYGLEGAVPDATAKLIVENEIIPFFKAGEYFNGLSAGINTVMELTRGEYSPDEYNQQAKKRGSPVTTIIFILIILGLVFMRSGMSAYSYSRTNNIGFWAALFLMSSATRSHSGYYNSFSGRHSGGFGGGSSFGGGFGGGSFGGGGAGGSW
jgi:uncharacterized protein